ncbi:hypothetical protein TM7_0461 [candidate division TM7 genomosp. GTL1]|nr:hypothetical protein TM7_0461 [candidate division TM7 genomosp. GTL1]
MTLLDVRRQIRTWAESRRPNLDIQEGTLRHSLYQYWRKRNRKRIPTENACHLLRVYLFWVPLFALREAAMAGPEVRGYRLPVPPIVGALGSVALSALFWPEQFKDTALTFVLIVLLALYVAAALTAGAFWLTRITEGREACEVRYKWRARGKGLGFTYALTVLTLPVMACFGAIMGLAMLCAVLFDEWKVHRPVATWTKRVLNFHHSKLPWLRPWVMFLAGGLIWVDSQYVVARRITGIAIGAVIVLAVFVVAGIFVYNKVYKNHVRTRPVRQAEALHSETTAQPSQPNWQRISAKLFRPLLPTGRRVVWLFGGLWGLLQFIFDSLWAVKIVGMCPTIKFVPAPEKHTDGATTA